MNYFCENYDPDGADAMKASYEEGEDVEVATASRLHALSTSFAKKSIDAMRSTEKSTKKLILCGYVSADQVRQHAKRMGSICLVAGTPCGESVMGLSLDRPLDDFHHCPEDCLLVGTHLHNAKSTHAAFKTWESLTQHCREMGIDESASYHAKMCAVFRPIIERMIRRWPEIKAVM